MNNHRTYLIAMLYGVLYVSPLQSMLFSKFKTAFDSMKNEVEQKEAVELGLEMLQAAKLGDSRTVLEKAEAGADINIQDQEGQTVLMLLIGKKDKTEKFAGELSDFRTLSAQLRAHIPYVFAQLLSMGANPHIKNKRGQTVYDLPKDPEIKTHLGYFDAQELRNTLRQAVSDNNVTLFHELLTKNDIFVLNEKYFLTIEQGLMIAAAEEGYNEIIKELVAAKLNSSKGDSHSGCTPLSVAINKDLTETVELLISLGVDLEETNRFGWTLLMKTINDGQLSFARLLIKAGAQVNAQEMSKNTPLILAARRGYSDLMKELICAGAKSDIKNADGKTAFDYLKPKVQEKAKK